ncbi:MAG TPA: tetratricopeptide repeat protein [Acidobacteriaceae bacterium]|nr:tetratricopeptide repeat protein [Acidobacteriaceae bacterium]
MGRSMSPVASSSLQNLHVPAAYYDQRLNRHFEVYAQNGKLYQSEFETDAAGKDIFRDTHQMQWIIGSGANGFGAILQQDKYLFQAPLSFYSKPMTWGPSPGYEFLDVGFNRPILAGCIFCHSGRPRPISATNGRFDNVPFSETAIGCENCHGPGAAHIQAMESATGRKSKDLSIVNPANLTSYLANNICMSCHQTGDVRVLKPGKNYQDFRPGKPLDDTLSILMVPPTRESPPDEDHTQHYYSMILSKCYRASAGRLRCITCHDPHFEPSSQEAPAYFNKKCLTCHTSHSCTLSPELRQHSSPPDNCISCHMPKRDVRLISHSSITNHRILARPGEPFPDITFQQTTPALPDLINLDPAPGKKDIPPPLLTLLQAYGELAASKPEYVTPYLKVLNQLSQTEPDNALVQAALGHGDLNSGKFQEAADHLQRALQLGPPQATVFADLSEALEKLGQTQEALVQLQNAIDQDPFNPVLQKTLVVRFIALKQYANAHAALEHYLQVFPQDSFMRHMLALSNAGTPAK